MTSRDAPAGSALFGSDLWQAALEKYADATHLTVTLFDADARAVFGPVHSTPLFHLFEEAGYDPGIFTECARRCIAQTEGRPPVLVSQFHGLAVVGASLELERKIVGAAVGGYALADFSQVSEIQRLAKQSGIVFERVWEVARKQPPVAQQRLIVYGELLQVLGDALLRENYRTRQYEQAAAIIDSSDDAIFSKDCDGVITSWNRGAERLFGYSGMEAVGQPIAMLVPRDRQQEESEILGRIMRDQPTEHFETIRVRKDGSPSEISQTVSPIKDSMGQAIGASTIARDIAERKRAEARLRESEEQLRLATEAAGMGLWDVDPINDTLFWPARVKAMFGISADVPVSMADFYGGLHPDDRERTSAAFADAVDPGKRALYDVEYRAVGREDGIIRWIAAKGRGTFVDGTCVRVIGAAIDISERKRAEMHRELLIQELNHRVKNTLATVQSIASQTLHNAKSTAEARAIFDSRLIALAKAHDVLTLEHWAGADLRRVVADSIAPYQEDGRAPRFSVDGPDLRLRPHSALALSMALHELATNAVKHGALSNGAGSVDIDWRVSPADRQRFSLRWVESGGPPVEKPRRRGFGSRLVEQGLAQDLAGEVRLDFERAGLVCSIEAPLAEVAAGVDTQHGKRFMRMSE